MNESDTHELIRKLAAVASDPVYQPQSVEEAVVKDVAAATSLPNGREQGNLFGRLTMTGQKYSTSEIELAIRDLVEAGIIKTWQPSGVVAVSRPTFYQLTLEFVKLMSKGVKEHVLSSTSFLEANVKIKGNEIALRDLAQFNKHVPWLLENYPDIKEVYCGGVRLSREEAAILLGEIEKQEIFYKD